MTKTITCSECGITKTALQLAWEGVLFYKVDGKITCEKCKEVNELKKEIKQVEYEFYNKKLTYPEYIEKRHGLCMEIYKLTAPDKAYCHICGACKTKGCEHYEKN